MIYNDDRCVQCGGTRVAFSTLCVDCLVKMISDIKADNREKAIKIKELEETLEKALSLIERLLDHVTREAIYTGILHRKIEELMDDVHGPDPEKG